MEVHCIPANSADYMSSGLRKQIPNISTCD